MVLFHRGSVWSTLVRRHRGRSRRTWGSSIQVRTTACCEVYIIIGGIEDVGEGVGLCVIFFVIKSHDFWSFCVVDIFWIVVGFIDESLDGVLMEVSACGYGFCQFDGVCLFLSLRH